MYVSTSSKYNLVAGAGADGPFNALCVFNVATNADLNIPYARFILCLGFKNCFSFLRGESSLLPQVSQVAHCHDRNFFEPDRVFWSEE